MTLQINSLTREYVKLPARVYESGEPVDVTAFPVFMAFIDEEDEDGMPEVSDWVISDWEVWPDNFFMARCLVGPGSSAELSGGTYKAWIKVEAAQEEVIRQVDRVVVIDAF